MKKDIKQGLVLQLKEAYESGQLKEEKLKESHYSATTKTLFCNGTMDVDVPEIERAKNYFARAEREFLQKQDDAGNFQAARYCRMALAAIEFAQKEMEEALEA